MPLILYHAGYERQTADSLSNKLGCGYNLNILCVYITHYRVFDLEERCFLCDGKSDTSTHLGMPKLCNALVLQILQHAKKGLTTIALRIATFGILTLQEHPLSKSKTLYYYVLFVYLKKWVIPREPHSVSTTDF